MKLTKLTYDEERRKNHHCHAMKCTAKVPPELLMCLKHWRMVPKPLQWQVRRHYRVGQCDDMSPSREWFVAASKAIAAVAEKEGIPYKKQLAADMRVADSVIFPKGARGAKRRKKVDEEE